MVEDKNIVLEKPHLQKVVLMVEVLHYLVLMVLINILPTTNSTWQLRKC